VESAGDDQTLDDGDVFRASSIQQKRPCFASRRKIEVIMRVLFQCLETLDFDFAKSSDTGEPCARARRRLVRFAGHWHGFDTGRRPPPARLLERAPG